MSASEVFNFVLMGSHVRHRHDIKLYSLKIYLQNNIILQNCVLSSVIKPPQHCISPVGVFVLFVTHSPSSKFHCFLLS